MSNRNLKYQNGIRKRDLARQVRAQLAEQGAFLSQDARAVAARLGFRPAFIIDTNIMFTLIQYWGDEVRAVLRDLSAAQPSLRLYLLDTVSAECRGSLGRQRLFDEIVYNGQNAGMGVIYPLTSDRGHIGEIASFLLARRHFDLLRGSDRNDARIAAAAIEYEMSVLTANGEDFAAYHAIDPRLRYLAIAQPGGGVEKALGPALLVTLGNLYVTRRPVPLPVW